MTPYEEAYLNLKMYHYQVLEELLRAKVALLQDFVHVAFPALHFQIEVKQGEIQIDLPANEKYALLGAIKVIDAYLAGLDGMQKDEQPITEELKK